MVWLVPHVPSLYLYVDVCVCMCVCVCVCVCVYIYIYIYIYTYKHTYIHIHTYIYTHTHTYIHTYVQKHKPHNRFYRAAELRALKVTKMGALPKDISPDSRDREIMCRQVFWKKQKSTKKRKCEKKRGGKIFPVLARTQRLCAGKCSKKVARWMDLCSKYTYLLHGAVVSTT